MQATPLSAFIRRFLRSLSSLLFYMTFEILTSDFIHHTGILHISFNNIPSEKESLWFFLSVIWHLAIRGALSGLPAKPASGNVSIRLGSSLKQHYPVNWADADTSKCISSTIVSLFCEKKQPTKYLQNFLALENNSCCSMILLHSRWFICLSKFHFSEHEKPHNARQPPGLTKIRTVSFYTIRISHLLCSYQTLMLLLRPLRQQLHP